MKRATLVVLAAVTAAALIGGCGGGKKEQAPENAPVPETQAAGDVGEQAPPVEAVPGRLPVPEGVALARASLTGTLGCGHCTFHVKESCALAMKTEAGEVYLVEAGSRQDELMGKRYDEPAVLVAGRIGEENGLKTIFADSVEVR